MWIRTYVEDSNSKKVTENTKQNGRQTEPTNWKINKFSRRANRMKGSRETLKGNSKQTKNSDKKKKSTYTTLVYIYVWRDGSIMVNTCNRDSLV